METLDVSRLPREAMYGEGPNRVDLASVVHELQNTFQLWVSTEMIKPYTSFGFAAAHPFYHHSNFGWDDPYGFTWFVVGWGDEGNRYIANAVRKLRPALRTKRDTLDLRLNDPHLFQDKVESAEADGTFAWGDFAWGGATFVRVGNLIIPCALSCLREVEDDAGAKTTGGHIGARMLKVDQPDVFNKP